jgi:Amt family ammonium transporter
VAAVRLFSAVALALAAFLIARGILLAQGDPSGEATIAADPEAGVTFVWTLFSGALVFFMQAGFALLGAGLIRAKNTVNYLTKNLLDFAAGGLSFWAFGFAFMFGGSELAPGLTDGNAVIGFSGFFLTTEAYDVTTIMFWFFQMMFAATTATIVAGAMAERTRVTAYLAYSFLVTAIVYPIYGHWMWGGGWLGGEQLEAWIGASAVDFAGSGVVHTIGGMLALAGAATVGARLGKYGPNRLVRKIPGHNMVYVVIGTFILFFGWFGFNGGSTVNGNDLRIAVIITNTFLAGATGTVVAAYVGLLRTGKISVANSSNGALAGLVGITAPCAFVAPWAAVVIGAVAAVLMLASVDIVERVLRVDDPVGAVSVHGTAGVWGLLAVGIFADGTYGGVSGFVAGNGIQFVAQLIAAAVAVAWALGTGLVLFRVLKLTMGLRASAEEERTGLDQPEHGEDAYGPDPSEADVPTTA